MVEVLMVKQRLPILSLGLLLAGACSGGPGTFDLVAYPAFMPGFVGEYVINPGYIYQIRFVADSLEGRIGPNTVAGKFPSGAETGLKVIPASGAPLKVENHTIVEVTVQFDPADSVRFDPVPPGKSPALVVKPVKGHRRVLRLERSVRHGARDPAASERAEREG